MYVIYNSPGACAALLPVDFQFTNAYLLFCDKWGKIDNSKQNTDASTGPQSLIHISEIRKDLKTEIFDPVLA